MTEAETRKSLADLARGIAEALAPLIELSVYVWDTEEENLTTEFEDKVRALVDGRLVAAFEKCGGEFSLYALAEYLVENDPAMATLLAGMMLDELQETTGMFGGGDE